MRKIITLLMLLLAASTAYVQAQSVDCFPYREDFETFGQCGTNCSDACTLTNGWFNSTTDDIDWTADNSGTGSSSTGPTANGGADHNPGVSGGTYLYTEASSPCFSVTAVLESPELRTNNFMNNFYLDFWYHMYGTSMGYLLVEVQQITGGVPGAWAQVDSIGPDNQDVWQNRVVDLSAWAGDTLKVRFIGNTGTNFYSDMALDNIAFYSEYANDAQIATIDAPVGSITPGVNNVDVTIFNAGLDSLLTAIVGWSVNGTPQANYNWTGTLPSGSSDSNVNIGSYNFPAGMNEICVWTEMPNGVPDSSTCTDTVCTIVCTPLSGTYTLGGGGADFATFADLEFALNSCGVDSHVVVNVNPGTYNERLVLGPIPGASDTSTVTIDGQDTSMVSMVNGLYANVYLNGADYVTIRRMTLINTAVSDGYGVQLADTAMYNTIDSCHIVMDMGTGLNDVIGISASGSETDDFIEGQNALWTTVSYNHIEGGEMGIHFEGQSALRTVGNVFDHNWIENPEDYGFYMDDQDSIMFTWNVIEGVRTTTGDGFYCFDLQMYTFYGNQALNVPDYGLYIADGNYLLDGAPTSRAQIINNMISSQTDYAAYFDDVDSTDIWHNTFYGSPGMRINDNVGVDIRNNLFYSDTDYAFESDDLMSLGANNTLNYNLYWTPATNTLFCKEGTGVYADLTTWQTANATDNVNSVEAEPVFPYGLVDLHVYGPAANDVGDNSVGITDDVDMESRPMAPSSTVDIGADEYTPIAKDAAFLQILTPVIQCGDSMSTVDVVIFNLGSDPIYTLDVDIMYSGDLSGSISGTYNDTLPFNQTDTFTVGTINTYAGAVLNFNGYITYTGDAEASNDSAWVSGPVYFLPVVPQGIDAIACGVDTGMISGAAWPAAAYYWYDSDTATTPIDSGMTFNVPSISTQGTYWIGYQPSIPDSLETTFASGNGCGAGNMFDLTATSSVTLTGLKINTDLIGSLPVNVYYIPNGTFAGNETNAGAWTLLGNFTGTGIGTNLPSPVDFGGNVLSIPAGATYAIYIEYDANYTNGTNAYSNADISVQMGTGLCSSFGGTNPGRMFNGRILYQRGGGCSTILSPVTIQSVTPPVLDLGADSTYCAGTLALDAGGSTGTNYNWNTGDSTAVITATMSGTYSVEVTDSFGCSVNDTVTIGLNPPPVVVLGADTVLCDGATLTLDAGNAGASYAWSTGGSSQTETVSATGTYSVVVTDSVGCSGTDTLSVTATNTPVASFTGVAGGNGLDYTFTDASTGPATSWSWDFGDGNTSTQQNPTHTYGSDNTYTVTLTVTNACGTDTDTQTITVVGLNELLAGGSMDLYPNPGNGLFTLDFTNVNAKDVRVLVTDLYGRMVEEISFEGRGDFREQIDIRGEASGVYMIMVQVGDESIMRRVVIQ